MATFFCSTATGSDQSLRSLIDRLESHFRLQRQTMGVLAQLSPPGSDGVANARDLQPRSPGRRVTASTSAAAAAAGGSFGVARAATSGIRFQTPRRVDVDFSAGGQSRYRSFAALADEDSSDTDTGQSPDSLGPFLSRAIIGLCYYTVFEARGPPRASRGLRQDPTDYLWRRQSLFFLNDNFLDITTLGQNSAPTWF